MSDTKIVFAGFGGQGLLFAGKVIAYAGLIENYEVSWLPSYGPEMRGGTATCSVILSHEPIGSPLIAHPTALVAMNQPSLTKLEHEVVAGGDVFVNTSLVNTFGLRNDLSYYENDATNAAEREGLKGLANMVLLGRLVNVTQCLQEESIYDAFKRIIPQSKAHLIDKNIQAFQLGFKNI